MQTESNIPDEEKISLKNVFEGFRDWFMFIIDKRKTIVYGSLLILICKAASITKASFIFLVSPLCIKNPS